MKYILLTSSILLSFIFLWGVAQGQENTCPIHDAPIEEFNSFVEQNAKIVNNIRQQLRDPKKNYGNSRSKTAYNALFSWWGYNSEVEYYLLYPVTSEIPAPVRRDYRILEKTFEWIEDFMKTIYNKYPEAKIVNVCDGVESCRIRDGNALRYSIFPTKKYVWIYAYV